jgi:hypothetical protein
MKQSALDHQRAILFPKKEANTNYFREKYILEI